MYLRLIKTMFRSGFWATPLMKKMVLGAAD